MKKYIFGTKGFAKEVEYILNDLNSGSDICFVAEDNEKDINIPINGREVITEKKFNEIQENVECYVAVGSPEIKNKIFKKLKDKNNLSFPNLIHPSVIYDRRYVTFGIGNIICSGVSITTNIKINNFVHINLNSTVGHDTIIEDYVTISPAVNISGNVHLEEKVYLGTNSTIIEKINIKKNIIIGAGCVVVKDLLDAGTYVGIPAKKLEK